MGKYSDEELSEMALIVLSDRRQGGMMSFRLIVLIATITGLEPGQVLHEIHKLVIR